MATENFKNVNVNGINYKLKLTTSSNPDLGKNTRGITFYEELKILLNKKCASELRIKTFYHELAHALCESTSFNNMLMERFSEDDYEFFVDQLGESIQMFIHNNDINDIENYVKKEGV